jgi:hypothetical protein
MRVEIPPLDWQPTPTQYEFLRNETRFRLLAGGFGSGKSSVGSRAFFRGVLQNRLCDAAMIAPTEKMFHSVMRPHWEQVCPPGLIARRDRDQECYVLTTGQKVYWRSAYVPERIQGLNLGTFWCDEARFISRSAWNSISTRLRDKRAPKPQGILTSTPTMNWLFDVFKTNRDEKIWKCFHISTRENAGNLTEDYVRYIQETFTERMCEAMIDGRFVINEGQVYPMFDPDRHMVRWEIRPDERIHVWIDFGARRASVLFAQETGRIPVYPRGWKEGRAMPPNSLVVFDELQVDNTNTERLIPFILAVLKRHNIWRPDYIFCDPAGRNRSQEVDMTSVRLLERAFGTDVYGNTIVRYQERGDAVHVPTGIGCVQSFLSPMDSDARLYFDQRLADDKRDLPPNNFARGIIPTLRNYRYPSEKEGRRASDHPLKDGFFEHAADALRYGIINTLVIAFNTPVGPHRLLVGRE